MPRGLFVQSAVKTDILHLPVELKNLFLFFLLVKTYQILAAQFPLHLPAACYFLPG